MRIGTPRTLVTEVDRALTTIPMMIAPTGMGPQTAADWTMMAIGRMMMTVLAHQRLECPPPLPTLRRREKGGSTVRRWPRRSSDLLA